MFGLWAQKHGKGFGYGLPVIMMAVLQGKEESDLVS